MSRLRAVIVDIDGTLLASNEAHARAFVDAGAEQGIEVAFEQVLRLIGKGGDKLIPEAFGFDKESEPGMRLDERKKEIFTERYLPSLEPTPGARMLLHRLRDDGIKLVVATSAGGDEMGLLLKQAGVDDLIQDATSSSDAEESKPDPDIVESAMEKAGFPADQMIMIGDTPYDVEAATRAGIAIVCVRTGGWDDADLHGAVAVYDHPQQLLDGFDESPLGRGK